MEFDWITPIDEGQAIIYANGIYRQVPIAERAGRIYAKYGAGYVRLHQRGGSSHSKVKWYQIFPGDGSYEEAQGEVRYIPPVAVAAQ